MSPRRRLLSLAYWLLVGLVAVLWARAVYTDTLTNPCPEGGCAEPALKSQPLLDQAGAVAGAHLMLVLLGGVVLYGLIKLAVWLWGRRRAPA